MYALPPPVPNYYRRQVVRPSDSFEQLMNAYGLNRVLVDEIPRLFSEDYNQSQYNPVHVAAASSYGHLPLLTRPCTSFQSTASYQPHPFMRRRSSLVEALNNGILAPVNNHTDAGEEREQEERLKMLRRRAIVRPNQATGKYPVQQDDFQQQPRALLRSYNQHLAREKRAQSQPLYQHQNCTFGGTDDSDDELTKLSNQPHISRADRFSIDSETGRFSQDSGINVRSSTHSSSSAATSSTISSDDRNSLFKAEAIFDHVAMLADELPFSVGDSIQILDSGSGPLWFGACRNRTGWFPKSYVTLRTPDANRLNSTLIACNNVPDDYPNSMRYLRKKVIEELMNTERDYVKLLQNLVEGFVEQCRRRAEMFNEERIRKIFANIEQIALLHSKLLRELELSFDQKSPDSSCVASAFLRNSQSFNVYTEYCNNRLVSCAELSQLEKSPQYHHFFEACRLLRGMPKLSLEGFLLTPVQRICRYPLQLLELLKATPDKHPDRYQLEKAQNIMKATAERINDGKRRIDAIQKIILWQRNVHGFRGPDLIETNNRLILSGELLCRAIMNKTVVWQKQVQVFLFDQSIVLCKKDVLKKGSLVFKERMSLLCSTLIDLPDGKESITDANLKHSFKLMGSAREYILTCLDVGTKSVWLENLRSRPASSPPTASEKRLALITLSSS